LHLWREYAFFHLKAAWRRSGNESSKQFGAFQIMKTEMFRGWTTYFAREVLRHYRGMILFVAVFTCCGIMVVQQPLKNQSRHVEMREAFILLYNRGYYEEADRLYLRLLGEMTELSNQELMDDFQRTLTLVNPHAPAPTNQIWNYHWTLSNKLEKRAASTLTRAIKLANEE